MSAVGRVLGIESILLGIVLGIESIPKSWYRPGTTRQTQTWKVIQIIYVLRLHLLRNDLFVGRYTWTIVHSHSC